MRQTAFTIEGMSCGHCVARVRKSLEALDGVTVEDVQVGSARVAYDEDRVSPERLRQVIDDAGYEARVAGEAA